ncbi:aldose epimerase family protein [Lacticaseibacillus camelliae]|uniref:Aldose 1-epimerase n=1 Tax=Lacticaseibacillus camelliae DSM 22697 = JCM 13995 TaxID=1423730 RepID=A0A0R2F6T0_9LACO|nr:aldose epimerase family protein [Lacticaseibacillus camelliae]KRN23366.1 aldose 1-epimerase [Lacticaseibacillus camelliae DSM 22697 = JCM 13995]
MSIQMHKYGTLRGEPLYEFILTNQAGMAVHLLNYGATLARVVVPTAHGPLDQILTLPSIADYAKERNFLGGTVGRVVGRLPGHVWHRAGGDVTLLAGEGDNAIHGGPEGSDTQVFTARYQESETGDQVTFTLLDPAGHNCFPGNVKTTVTYTLHANNTLTFALHAVTDEETLYNPTNHVYFALDGLTAGIDDATLTLAADHYAPLDDHHLPSSGWAPVAGTPFDFRSGAKLGDRMPQVLDEQGFDHPFLIKKAQAVLLTGKTGRKMALTTTAPAVVMYTANHFDHSGIAHNIGAHSGVALEAQIAPPSGQDWSSITLLPGEPYDLETSWRFFE